MGSDSEAIAAGLRLALGNLNRQLRAQETPNGVGATGLSVLGRLLRSGPSTPTVLAAQERVAIQSLTRVLQALEAGGLATRAVDPADRRRSTITITPEGIDALRRSARSREAWLAAALDATLSGTEREILRLVTPLLQRVADAGA